MIVEEHFGCQCLFMTEATPRIRAMFGTSAGAAGVHNRRVVIDAIRVNGALSRAELARATKLAKQTLSNIIEELERAGLVVACAAVKEGRGKPATPYALAPLGAFSVGLQIDRHLARCVLVNLLGEVVCRRDVRLEVSDPEAGFRSLTALIARTRQALAGDHPDSARRTVGLGMAMPGPFGPRARRSSDETYTMARWQDFPLISRLEQATGLSVNLQNDAAAAATAEKLTGRAHGLRNVVCLYLGYGLGAGLVLNGELFAGEDGNAGEIGMLSSPFDAETPLEHVVSLGAFCKRFGLDHSAPGLFAEIEGLLCEGGSEVDAWLEAAAKRLDWVAELMQVSLAPQAVVLCGTAPPLLIEILARRVNARRGAAAGRPSIEVGLADPWTVAIGAAAEPISRNFDPRYSALFKS